MIALEQYLLYNKLNFHKNNLYDEILFIINGKCANSIHNKPLYITSNKKLIIYLFTDCASEIQRNVFLIEGAMLVGIHHENILTVLAAVVPQDKAPILIFPHSSQGNLKKFLQSCHTLLTKEVVGMGVQVLQALAFLHSKLLLHKDVATRNCV